MKPSPWLLPFSWIYGAGTGIRNMLYDRGILRSHEADVPVVSVGNISTGGTGKTQAVELLAAWFRDRGKKTAVLSRGYGRKKQGYLVVSNGAQRCAEAIDAGDEPAQMAENLTGVVIAVDEDRVNGARRLIGEFHPQVVILDDGFQHRGLRRSCDIVLLTANELLRGNRLLPAGYGREPLSSLSRADVLVITGFTGPQQFQEAAERVGRFAKTVAGMTTQPASLQRALSGEPVRRENLKSRYVAFSGIGNPGAFESSLRAYLGSPVSHEIFDDHHWYSAADMQRLEHACALQKAEYLVTTQKDAMRLTALGAATELDKKLPILVLRIVATMTQGGQEFMKRLEAV